MVFADPGIDGVQVDKYFDSTIILERISRSSANKYDSLYFGTSGKSFIKKTKQMLS